MQKLAFAAQSERNVEINKDKMVEIVKKNYKGNWETYKRHNNIINFHNENKSLEIIPSGNPLSSKIIQLKDDPHSYLKYLKISQMSGNKYEIGDSNKMRTEFCLLKTEDGDNLQEK